MVHLAALSNDPLSSLPPEIIYDINHHASTRLARLAKGAGGAAVRLRLDVLGVRGAAG